MQYGLYGPFLEEPIATIETTDAVVEMIYKMALADLEI